MLEATLQTPSRAQRLRSRPFAVLAVSMIACEALAAAVGAEMPALAVLVLVLAPGLALMPILPQAITRVPAAALAAAPALGVAASTVLLISLASLGLPLDGAVVRIGLGALALAGLILLPGEELTGPAGSEAAWQAAALGAIVTVGIVLQERVIGGWPLPGNDWAKYVLYADEVHRHHSLLIDNPYWMLGAPFREDPGAPALFGSYLAMTGRAAASVAHGIWVLAVVGILSTFAWVRAYFGAVAGALAAGFVAVLPATQDILAWHGVANVAALALIPLLLAYVTTLVDGGLGWREAGGLALCVVALAATHRLSFFVAMAGLGLGVGLLFALGGPRRAILTGIGRALVVVAVIAPGVAYDLFTRGRTFGGTLDYTAYLPTKLHLWPAAKDLGIPFVAVSIAAVAATAVWSRRDRRLLLPLSMLAVVVVLAYAWIVHIPAVYFRMTFFVPTVVAPLTAVALVRWFGPVRAARVGAGLVLACAVIAWTRTDDLRSFYGFADRTSLRGMDLVAERLDPNDAVVTDRCWSFLTTWLLHAPTLPALEPQDIQPKAELKGAREARSILAGTPEGRRLARRLHVRFLIVAPDCVDAQGNRPRPPTVGKPLFVSRRLVVLSLY